MTFRQELNEETVASLPTRKAIMVQPYTLVRAAIAVMRNRGLGCAVIIDHAQRPSGIFTEHSVIQLLNKNVCLDDTPVCDFADPSFIQVKQTDPIMHVWEAVQTAAVRFVCVTDEQGRAIGITGQRGLSEYLADCFARQITVQRLGNTPWMKQREGA